MSSNWSEELGDFQSHAEYPLGSVVLIGVGKIELFLPHCHSLKDKRQQVLKLKQKLRDRFKLNVSEIAWQDKWQRTTIAFATVGAERPPIQACLDQAISCVEENVNGEILDIQMEILSF